MGILKDNLQHIKDTETRVRNEFGINVSVTNIDSWTQCSRCSFDSAYKGPGKPNCPVCSGRGKIATKSTHVEKVLPLWITEENIEQVEIGSLNVGDVKLKARIDSKDYFENAIQNEIVLSIDGRNMLPKKVVQTIVASSIWIYCVRSQKKSV